jgi:23S rRNA (guanosine2251-2'-O)-methyltransferase
VILILDNIRSVHNVGSIFRTADAAGVEKIFLAGYTPTPLDRFKNPRKDFAKVSLGAEQSAHWEQFELTETAIATVHAQGYTVAALEQHPGSSELFSYIPPKKFALVVGNEVEGVSSAALKACDIVLEIPMHGSKESLNVSVATGVALFTLLHKP